MLYYRQSIAYVIIVYFSSEDKTVPSVSISHAPDMDYEDVENIKPKANGDLERVYEDPPDPTMMDSQYIHPLQQEPSESTTMDSQYIHPVPQDVSESTRMYSEYIHPLPMGTQMNVAYVNDITEDEHQADKDYVNVTISDDNAHNAYEELAQEVRDTHGGNVTYQTLQ